MTGTYTIRLLPEEAITAYPKKTKKGKSFPDFRIKEKTFPEVSKRLPIRMRAALHFVERRNTPIYVVLHKNSKSISALFFFTFAFTNPDTDKRVLEICRCIGRNSVKRHWKTVLDFINNNKEKINNLSTQDCLTFNS